MVMDRGKGDGVGGQDRGRGRGDRGRDDRDSDDRDRGERDRDGRDMDRDRGRDRDRHQSWHLILIWIETWIEETDVWIVDKCMCRWWHNSTTTYFYRKMIMNMFRWSEFPQQLYTLVSAGEGILIGLIVRDASCLVVHVRRHLHAIWIAVTCQYCVTTKILPSNI